MYKKWHAYHSISALSHFTRYDMPRPFSDSSYYIDIIRNIFVDKYSTDVVEIELVYDVDVPNGSSYSEVKIYSPRIDKKIQEIIDVEKFVEWYSERYDAEMKFRHNNNIATYFYGDGYTRHAITIYEIQDDFDFILIQYKTGRYDL